MRMGGKKIQQKVEVDVEVANKDIPDWRLWFVEDRVEH